MASTRSSFLFAALLVSAPALAQTDPPEPPPPPRRSRGPRPAVRRNWRASYPIPLRA